MRITTLIRCEAIIKIGPHCSGAKEERNDGECGGYMALAKC